ncbi:MAG: ABC transporter permease [Bacteroidetes bacterium]|nr:ABC transporter permease [Bacteroidota bacterium]
MIRNYLLTFFRNLAANKLFSALNIFGLMLGLISVYFIGIYLVREMSFDDFHTNSDDLYRVVWISKSSQTRTPHPLAQEMVRDFPEVQSAVSLSPLWGPGLTRRTFSIRNRDTDVRFDESSILAVDSTFFSVFDFKLLKGDAKTVLTRPGGILLSQAAAFRYFGKEDPIGKTLSINGNEGLLSVVGVFKDVPELSHFHFDFLISYVTQKAQDPDDSFFKWEDFGHYNYIRLNANADPKKVEERLMAWSRKYINFSAQDYAYLQSNNFGFKLQPIRDIHLRSNLRWELETNGNIDYVIMMGSAALLLLIVVSFNFINLSGARAIHRAREIGVRKSVGATRSRVALQFLVEAILTALISGFVAIGAIILLTPWFNSFINAQHDTPLYLSVFAIVSLCLVIGVFAGVYPALTLSSVKATQALKGFLTKGPTGRKVQNGMLFIQFVASLLLLFCCTIIYSQLSLIREQPLGFDHESTIVIPIKSTSFPADAFLKEVQRIPGVSSVTTVSNIPGKGFNQNSISPKDDPQHTLDASEFFVDYDFISAMGLELSAGRTFDRTNAADVDAFMLNETAARKLNIGDAVGKEIVWDNDGERISGRVIGIVADFNFQSLHEVIQPLMIRVSTDRFNYVIVRTADRGEIVPAVEKTWKKFENNFAFQFSFMSDEVAFQYRNEEKAATLLSIFAIIAVAVAIIGLVGVASVTLRAKVKEISIRKFLGAKSGSIIVLLTRPYVITLCTATIVAIPAAVILMGEWLDNFSYRTSIRYLPMIVVIVSLAFITGLSLVVMVLKVAKSASTQTLRSE